MSHPPKRATRRVPTGRGVRAQALNLTDAKRIRAYGVRAHRLNGASLRRQDPNFVCHRARLVEIDSGQRFAAEKVKLDTRRDACLAARGYQVLRLRNRDVMTDRQTIAEASGDAVLVASRSPPSRAIGRGGPSAEPAP